MGKPYLTTFIVKVTSKGRNAKQLTHLMYALPDLQLQQNSLVGVALAKKSQWMTDRIIVLNG